MEEKEQKVALTNISYEDSSNVNQVTVKGITILKFMFYLIGIISIVFAWKWYNADLDISSSGDPFRFHEKTYVGGDAYNYIISAARSSAIMTKSLVWMIVGCSSVVVGVLCSIKEKLCK